MTLYHASLSTYTVGQEVSATSPVAIFPNAAAVVDSMLTNNSRLVAVFATDDPAAAVAFLQAELRYKAVDKVSQDIYLYEVEMKILNRGPMRLIKEVEKALAANKNVDALVEEYVNPKKKWLFWEYYGPKFKVVRRLTPASQDKVDSWSTKYGTDSINAEEFSGI